MPVIDFSKIPTYKLGYTDNEPPVVGTKLLDDIAGPADAQTAIIYDQKWGYFTVGEMLSFRYEKTPSYKSSVTFDIKGVFTINAEHGKDIEKQADEMDPDDLEDSARFIKLYHKYNDLLDLFERASDADPPEQLVKYGTAQDNRCVALPGPIRDDEGRHVYARPIKLEIMESQWPHLIVYQASLEDVRESACEVSVDDLLLDNAKLDIDIISPRLHMRKYAFANSSEPCFGGWNSRSVSVSGSIPSMVDDGQISSELVTSMVNKLSDGRVSLKLVTAATEEDGENIKGDIMTDLFVGQPTVSVVPGEGGHEVRFSAKE